ncbi:MAG: PKD domain-containing protein, partial [Planctomycetes bacterium]|nr:PKD domain-containing protein [Planctomycetota bacterium]
MSARRHLILLIVTIGLAGPSDPRRAAAGVPAAFVENRGQWSEGVRFATSGQGLRAEFERDGFTIRLDGRKVRLVFEGASDDSLLEGEARTPGAHHFIRGRDRAAWRFDVPSFERIAYRGLYDGIDVAVRDGGAGRIEYDVLIEPGADPDAVVMRCDGASDICIEEDGTLRIETGAGDLRQPPPRTWQVAPRGERRPLACAYRLLDERRIGFHLPRADRSLPLVIDPIITYAGGNGDESSFGLAVGPDGTAFVGGYTMSSNFPAPPEGTQEFPTDIPHPRGWDALIIRVDASLENVLSTTVFGGRGDDTVVDLAVDEDGVVTAVGWTNSTEFPLTENAYASSPIGGRDAFVVRLDPRRPFGEQLVYSTLLGGSSDDIATAVALDPEGKVCVTGYTCSDDFPVTEGAYQEAYGGGANDVFLTRIDPSIELAGQLRYSTYLGGAGQDGYHGDNLYFYVLNQSIAVEGNGDILLAGHTVSRDFPTTPGAMNPVYYGGQSDVYVCRIRPDGSLAPAEQLRASTYLGGSLGEISNFVGVDREGAVLVAGSTYSSDGVFAHVALGRDVFVIRMLADLTDVISTTFIGGAGDDLTEVAALDGSGRVVVGGCTWGSYPTTPNAVQRNRLGERDAILALVDPGLPETDRIVYSTLLGGGDWEELWGIAVAQDGSAFVTGYTDSGDLPVTLDLPVMQKSYSGAPSDLFIGRFDFRFPAPRFDVAPAEGLPPLTIAVDASASETPEGTTITGFAWDFGDGTTGEGVTASHTYTEAGRHAIVLTVRNSVVNDARATEAVTVGCVPGDVSPWTAADIGAPLFPGSACREGEAIEVCAGGHGIVGSSDEVHFV